jgi:hypothetical protein
LIGENVTIKKAIIISAVSVGLILAISFGITSVIAKSNNASQVEMDLVSKIAQREANYKKLLDEANQRIQALNAQVQANGQTQGDAQTQGNIQAQANSPENNNVSTLTADNALAIAYQSVGNDQALNGVPELVSYQGTPAFEIPFVNGMVYIDAASGSVIASTMRTQITEQQAIAAVGDYLKIKNTSNAVVKKYTVNGTDIYKVFINNYVLVVDKYGTITQFQIVQYNSSPSSSPAPKGGGGESDSGGD